MLRGLTGDVSYLHHYRYTRQVVDVLASAIEYGLEGLAQCCVEFISRGLKVDTACEAMQAAITYSQPQLRDMCMDFIEKNTTVGPCTCSYRGNIDIFLILASSGFHNLSSHCLSSWCTGDL